jgi:hypothetical protein
MQTRIAAVLLAAFAFGLRAAWIKGPGGDDGVSELRSVLGNVSTPWLLVAFVAGTRVTNLRSGALVGLAATGAASLDSSSTKLAVYAGEFLMGLALTLRLVAMSFRRSGRPT